MMAENDRLLQYALIYRNDGHRECAHERNDKRKAQKNHP
ncbi:hypothetical protein N643_08665 [Salmonella bongori serovar 48:z41:-- str. RKS3044]|uniref:Uncharacterized protein n=1 Tax=Salmonella bongori N268-08 TaxID=1197719 RepID=S5MXG1_SALBN|nr:hypothetical protein A464_2094 [Salmonella bongori N268-08]AID27263.1 hypothetical protein N643_08665 [Salmonella bongori serovar 48:z41:-- str. RKS3044]